MPELPPPEQLVELLVRQPALIAELTDGLTDRQLGATPSFGGWSANEVLAHLRSCADVWGGRLDRILREDHPTIQSVNPTTWILQTDYPVLPFSSSFAAYRTQRKALLRRLERLAPEDWLRSAEMLGAGRPLQHSAHRYVEWIAVHERPHVKQIRRIADDVRAQAG